MATLTWHGHSCFELETREGRILIDPFLTGNPKADVRPDEIDGIDAIVVSHGHGDHWGDTVAIAKRTGAIVVAAHELSLLAAERGCSAHGLACGGGRQFDFGHVKLVPAAHGSLTEADPKYSTNPCGIVISAEGKMFYHAGDTALTADIKLLGEHDYEWPLASRQNGTLEPFETSHGLAFRAFLPICCADVARDIGRGRLGCSLGEPKVLRLTGTSSFRSASVGACSEIANW